MSVITIPAGMKVWAGGEQAPEDWGNPVETRAGSILNGVVEGSPFWNFGREGRNPANDYIAYTPKTPPVAARSDEDKREILLDILRMALSQEKTGSKSRSTILIDASARILDLFAAPCSETDWRSIDSAPLDGTHILLAGQHSNHGWVQKVGTFFAGQWWSNGSSVAPDMTRWMPLPDVPTSETDRIGGVGV
jgi:hypothetical protein